MCLPFLFPFNFFSFPFFLFFFPFFLSFFFGSFFLSFMFCDFDPLLSHQLWRTLAVSTVEDAHGTQCQKKNLREERSRMDIKNEVIENV